MKPEGNFPTLSLFFLNVCEYIYIYIYVLYMLPCFFTLGVNCVVGFPKTFMLWMINEKVHNN